MKSTGIDYYSLHWRVHYKTAYTMKIEYGFILW